MVLRVLCCQHSTQGKALTTVGIVGDRDQIGIGVIADGMDARHLTTTDMIHTKVFLICCIFLPGLFTVDIFHDFIG